MSERGPAPEHEFVFMDGSITGDNMNVFTRDGNLFDFEIDEPWAGDTEYGFGQKNDITLPRDKAVKLARWIMAWANFTEGQDGVA